MAITYRDESFVTHATYRFDDSVGSFSHLAWNDWDYDILADDTVIDDWLLFQQQNSYGWKFWKIDFDVDTAIVADTIEWVWEYRKIDWGMYWRNFEPLTIIEDTVNNFTVAWTKHISFEVPDDWDNIWVMTWTQYYHWSVRFRITNLSNVTNKWRITNSNTYPDRIHIDTGTVTMEDVYQADVTGWWGKVLKSWISTYTLDCWLYCYYPVVFNSSAESITFIHNNMPFIRCKTNFWELTSTGKPTKWTLFRCEWANVDYNNCYLWYYDSTFYDTTIKFPRESRNEYTQWFWGAWIGSAGRQKIKGWSFTDFRSYWFSHSDNIISWLTYAWTFTEPTGSTLFDMVSISSPYWSRPNSAGSHRHIHRFDLTDVTTACTNPRMISIDNWREKLVDCKINYNLPLANFRASSSANKNHKVEAVNSFQAQVLDASSNAIDNVNVSIFDNINTKVNALTTNEDWFIWVEKWVTTNSWTDTLESNSYSFTNKRFTELYLTNWTVAWHRSIIHKAESTTKVTLAEPNINSFGIWNRFIEIPYIVYRSQRVPQDWTSWYETLFEHWPFRVSYRKYWYNFQDDWLSFSDPLVSLRKLPTNNYITLSEINAWNLTWIVVDWITKTITISEEKSATDIYDYTQYWASLSSNLEYDEPITTFDWTNYILATGWKLILNAKITGQYNINWEINLNSGLNLDNINLIWELKINTWLNSNLTFNNIQVSWNVWNDDIAHTLTINSTWWSVLNAGDNWTWNWETNIIVSASLTVSINKTWADVVILKAWTDIVLDSVDAQTWTDFNYAYTIAEDIDIWVIVQWYIINYTYWYTLTWTDAILPITLLIDRAYD